MEDMILCIKKLTAELFAYPTLKKLGMGIKMGMPHV
jgi:hypothetical protein